MEYRKLADLKKLDNNPRLIKKDDMDRLVKSINDNPDYFEARPLILSDRTGELVIIAGNQRYEAAKICGLKQVPTFLIEGLTEAKERELVIRDNVSNGQWDYDALANEWDEADLDAWGVPAWQTEDESLSAGEDKPITTPLAERFIVPPFSILDTRQGYWQQRKRAWRERIGDMGESRTDTLYTSPEMKYKDLYLRTTNLRKELGAISFGQYIREYCTPAELQKEAGKVLGAGVSLLDPVMAEIICHWFSFPGAKVIDPFAGDTIFGYVAANTGMNFTGIELRPEQSELNNSRVDGMTAKYICDDGRNIKTHIKPESQDLLFSCPPYFDLEHYSDLPNDASNQNSYSEFLDLLKTAFSNALSCLKDNRFAVVVIGDVRNKRNGYYLDLISDIKRIFIQAGAGLYNELILIDSGTTSAMRASRNMINRKVCKMHQNILVFYKGDPSKIRDTYKKIEYASEDLEPFNVDSGDETGVAETELYQGVE